ncbi:MAG TPA: proprotein convertase P-domain-containing protein [Candidatus Hydrogenedens sp.]|nr:proprotein convertase P-domain-containing protein [Candidatus Hydrogenedens sp.]HPP58451.1 proprotein convertase P-domain-containing protein [Candidatus Hydrogenedens sp.]
MARRNAILIFLLFLFPCLCFSDIPRILYVGDSWTYYPWALQDPPALRSVLLRPEMVQQLGGRYIEVGDIALHGATAGDWDTDNLKAEITQKLNEYPTIDIVHISLGGNDINVGWKYHYSWEQTNAVIDTAIQHLRNVIQHCLSVRPNVRVAICGYDYLNISEGYTWGTYTNPYNPFDITIYVASVEQPTQLALWLWEVPVIVFNPQYPWLGWTTIQQVGEYQRHVNDVFIELERRKKDLALSMDRVAYIHSFGTMQARMGIPSLGIGQNYSVLPQGPNEGYGNFPAGYRDLFSPRQAMGANNKNELDPIHLNAQGYIYLMENAVAQVYGAWLKDSDPPFVDAIQIVSDNPPSGDTVAFQVKFSESVRGVDTGDFRLDVRGDVHGAEILRVEGGGDLYTVFVSTPSGNGSLSIDLIDNDTIYDNVWNPLAGMADGTFIYGEYYTIGTGVGGGGDIPNNCPLLPILDEQGRALYPYLGVFWEFGDIDNNGMLDAWEVGPLAEVYCNPTHPLYSELLNAYNTTLRGIRSEPAYASLLQPVEHLVTALLLLDSSMCSAVKNGLSAVLTKPYIPFVINRFGIWIEPFNPNTDIDLDGLSNRQEYQEVMDAGLPFAVRENYIIAVLNPKCPEGIKSEFAESLKYLYELRINIPFMSPICLVCKDPYTTDLDGNQIIDYAQALLEDLILACQTTLHYDIVASAYIHNNIAIKVYLNRLWDGLSRKYWNLPVEQGIGLVVDLGKVEKALTGLLTLGEPSSLAVVKAIFDGANAYLNTEDRINVNVADFNTSASTVLGATGDADDDGVCNLSEYNAVSHDLAGLASFVAHALNPSVRDNGGGCDGVESNNGEEPTQCPLISIVDLEGQALYSLFPELGSWANGDWDGNGMKDSWESALLADVLCDTTYYLNYPARQKYTGNLYRLRNDSTYSIIRDYEHVLAVLMTISQSLADKITKTLGLSGFYYSFKMPPVDGEESCGPGGDPDSDQLSNKIEYNYVIGKGGTREEYVYQAKTPAGGFNVDRCPGLCEPNQPICEPVDFDSLMRTLQKRIRELGFESQLGGYSFDPGSTDINGGYDEQALLIFPNGILDSDEFALINFYMTRSELNPISQHVCNGWNRNVSQMYSDLGGASGLINILAPELHKVLAGYMLLGDDNSVSVPIKAISTAVNAQGIDLGVHIPDLSNYTRLPHILAYNADPDGDGYSNLEEYQCFRLRSRCCYLQGVTRSDWYPSPEQCIELEGEGEEEGIIEGFVEGEGIVEGINEGTVEGEGVVEGAEEGEPINPCAIEPCSIVCGNTEPIMSDFESALVSIYQNPLVNKDPEISDLDGNGIIDRTHAKLVDAVLGNPFLPNHCCVRSAYETNLLLTEEWADEVQSVQPVLFLIIPRDIAVLAIAGLMTLGEEATIRIITDELENSSIPIPVPDINAFDRSSERFLAYNGDADLDGICNLGEYNAVATEINGADIFITNALNPQITYDGGGCPPCIEGEGIVEGNLEGVIEGGNEGDNEGTAEGSSEGTNTNEGEGISEGSIEGEGTVEEGEIECIQFYPFDTPQTIRDAEKTISHIYVDKNFIIEDIEIGIYVIHESLDQLTIWLESPQGDRIYLASRVGGSLNSAYEKVIFDDSAEHSISEGTPPFTGRFKPFQPLSPLIGKNGMGTWKLVIFDWVSGKSGRLIEWRIVFNRSCEFEWNTGNVGDGRIWHSADTNHDWKIQLTELLRVIQLFNSRGFHIEEGTEDGYAPGLEGSKDGLPHHSDYNPQNWQIELAELLRLIQFFNYSEGYSQAPGSEDGFNPGTSGLRPM